MTRRTTLLLKPPPQNSRREDAASEFFSQLSEILKDQHITISVEILVYDKFLWFFLTCPDFVKEIIKGQLYSYYPDIEIVEVQDYAYRLILNNLNKVSVGTELYLGNGELRSLLTYKELNRNPLVSLSGAASSFDKGEVGFIQLVIEPPKKESTLKKVLKVLFTSSDSGITNKDDDHEDLSNIYNKEKRTCYKSSVRFLASSSDKQKAKLILSTMIAAYKRTLERSSKQKLRDARVRSDRTFMESYVRRALGRHKFALSSDEISTFFHLPYKEEEISQVVQVKSKRAPAPQNLPSKESSQSTNLSVFGETNFQNKKIQFGIKTEDRRRHLYVIGKSGMGKSKLLELLMQGDLNSGQGAILLDPHGDFSKEILNFIPENRIQDVVYFDPSDMDFPIGFNPMEGVGDFEFRQNIVNGFVSIFKKLFGYNWNERFEHVLRYTTLALLEYPQASVLGIPRMLTDNLFRQEVLSYVTDPLVKKFWTTEFATWNEQFASEAIVPIINKIGQFVANPMIRNIVGQTKTGFSLEDIMNNRKILIANLSKGKLGEENSALLGSMLITKIWQTAISRASIPEEERKDVFLYVDEFQNFATTAFANILSEARKYRLNLTVAHQYMQQLPEEVRATVFGNVGNIVSFRVGGDDAQVLANEFEPVFNVNDFLNLDMRNFFIKMSIDGQTSSPFSAQTIITKKPEYDNSQRIIELSRRNWAKTRQAVEEEIEMLEKGAVKYTPQALSHGEESMGTYQQPNHEIQEEYYFPEPII